MLEKNLPITGGCLCGAIRYEATGGARNCRDMSLPDVSEGLRRAFHGRCGLPEKRF